MIASSFFSKGLSPVSIRLLALLFALVQPQWALALSWNPSVLRSTPSILVPDPNNPGTLYSGLNSVHKSVDGGATWNELNAGLYTSIITGFAISPLNPDILYVTSIDTGIWSVAPDGTILSHNIYALPSPNINTLAVDPVYGIRYVGIRGSGVYKSLASWGAMNSGLTNLDIIDLVIDPVNTSTLYAIASGGELFKSTNGAGIWGAVNTGQSVRTLAIDPVNPSTLYIGTDGGGVRKSYDGGTSWTAINSGLTHLVVNALAIDPLSSTRLFAGTDGGVFESADGGANWTAANSGLAGTLVTLLEIDPAQPQILYVGTDGGLQKNADEIAPVITLVGDAVQTVAQGSPYWDPGATASDNIDTGLVPRVSGSVDPQTIGTYVLTYNVSDSAGNAAVPVTRTVHVTDQTAPVITLLGDNPMTLTQGESFSDPGASVTDNVDTGLSATVTGRLATDTLGSYVLTYSATDSAGNTAAPVTRTVNVVAAPSSSGGASGGGGGLDPIFLVLTALLAPLTLRGVRLHSTR